jgi:DNA helicase-2/ATP-dependent DNA helicase PcrA
VLTTVRGWAADHRLTLRQALERVEDVPGLPPAGQRALAGFAAMLARWTDMSETVNLLDLLDDVLSSSNYASWVRDGTDEGDERWANVQELRSLALQYAAMPPRDGLDALLENAALVADTDRLPDADDVIAGGQGANKVTLITLHAAKGLEYPVVFITGLEEGLFPHSRSLDDPRQMEEERRLAYVGITRAKRHLYLISARRRTVFGNQQTNMPSRFVKDIPANLLKEDRRSEPQSSAGRSSMRPIAAIGRTDAWFDQPESSKPAAHAYGEGELVRHNVFGLGTVLATKVDGQAEVVVVRFKDGRGKPIDKTLDTNFARLEPV